MRDSFVNFISDIINGPLKKDLSESFLLFQREMKLRRSFKVKHLTLHFVPLIKSFLKTLLLMIRRYPGTVCLWHLSAKEELLNLHGKLTGFAKNTSKSTLWQTF